MSYPRTLNWVINFKLPEGYVAQGLNELNTTVENESGAYSCVADQQNGTLILKITKKYKLTEMPKEKWDDVLSFTDAAYRNSLKYILLKPKT